VTGLSENALGRRILHLNIVVFNYISTLSSSITSQYCHLR